MQTTSEDSGRRRKIVLGLTGNIACGKSTVCAMLAELGAEVIDADRVVHDVLRLPAVVRAVAKRFGAEVLAPDGQVDRRILGTIVFADAQGLADLEGILYPDVLRWIDELVAASPARVVVIDAIKLYEAGIAAKCDAVWTVTCPTDQQVRRLMATRGLSEEEAWVRIRAQAPQEEKAARADLVIDNSGSVEETRAQARRAYERLGMLA
ncbi:MAG: dephospho-CoA kinase [Chloroflexi bacterium]|nr:dephospho-CoA kinase [Chloroflexota bacterium]